VVSLTNREVWLPAPGPTFAGRDILAPAAGQIAGGVPVTELGEVVDPAGLVPGLVSLPQEGKDGAIAGEVWWVDRFGNCQLNIDPDELVTQGAAPGGPVQVRFRDEHRRARWVTTYAEAKPSELVLLVDSYGLLALALDRTSAAEALGLRAGAAVTVVAPGGAE
jgi:S-adenosylmethionine hydrolase